MASLGLARSILFLQVMQGSLAFVFVPLVFRESGFTIGHLVLLYALMAGIGAISIPLVPLASIRSSLSIGALLMMGSSAAMFLDTSFAFFGFVLCQGLSLAFFWIPFNYIFFERSADHASDSSRFLIIPTIFGALLPLIAIRIVEKFNYGWLFGISFLIGIVLLVLVLRSSFPHVPVKRFSHALAGYSSLRTITFLEGGLHYFMGAIVPVYSLLFFTTQHEFGGFLVFVNLVAVIPMAYLAGHSDRTRMRLTYLAPILLFMAVLSFALGASKGALLWVVLVGLYTIADKLSWPLRLAITMDGREKSREFWRAREFFLNVGRVTLLGLSAACFFLGVPMLAFALFASLFVAYPILIKKKLRAL